MNGSPRGGVEKEGIGRGKRVVGEKDSFGKVDTEVRDEGEGEKSGKQNGETVREALDREADVISESAETGGRRERRSQGAKKRFKSQNKEGRGHGAALANA